jgi:hypothetical protein
MANLKVELELTGAQEASKTYKQVLQDFKDNEKELKALAIAGDTTSKRYQQLAKSVGQAKAQIDEANRSITAQKGTFDLTINALGGAAAGYTALRGAAGLFGAESENLQKSLLKVQSALALAQGLKQFQEAIPIFKTLSLVVGRGLVGAFNALKTSIGATGIGLLVIGIGFLITKVVEWTNATKDNAAAQENLSQALNKVNSSISNLRSSISDQLNDIEDLTTRNRLLGDTEQQIFEQRQRAFANTVSEGRERINSIVGQIARLKQQGATEEEINKLINERKDLDQSLNKIETKASNERLANQNRLLEVEERNQKRRTQLIRSELGRRLQELRDNYNKERREAIKNGEDLNLIERKYQEDRTSVIKKSNEENTKIVNDFWLELALLTDGGYELILSQQKLNQAKEIESLSKKLEDDLLLVGDNLEEIKKININFDNDLTNLQLKQALERNELLSKTLKNGYGVLIELEKQLSTETIQEVKKRNGITENLQNLSITQFKLEYKEKERIQLQALRNATIADADFFFERVRNSENIDGLNQKELGLYTQLQKVKEDDTLSEEQRVKEIAKIRQDFFNQESNRVLTYYSDLSKLQFDFLENSILLEIDLNKIEKENTQEKLEIETQYYKDLEKLQNTDIKNVEKFNTSKVQLDRKLKLDQLLLELKNLDLKIKLYGEDTDEFKKFQLQKLKIQTEINEIQGNIINEGVTEEQEGIDKRKRVLESYAQESINILNELQFTIGSFYDLDVARFNAAQDKKLKKLQDNQKKEVNNYALTNEQVDNINRRYALAEEKLEEERAKKLKEIEKERADTNFAITIGQIVANTGLAVMRAFADLGPVAGIPAAALIGVASGLQITAAINQRNLVTKLEDGGLLRGASHSNGGIPIGNTGIEVEGGEYVVNKRSTQAFLPLIEAINNAGRTPSMPTRMQNGGMLTDNLIDAITTNKQPMVKTYLTTTDLRNKMTLENRIMRKSRF